MHASQQARPLARVRLGQGFRPNDVCSKESVSLGAELSQQDGEALSRAIYDPMCSGQAAGLDPPCTLAMMQLQLS